MLTCPGPDLHSWLSPVRYGDACLCGSRVIWTLPLTTSAPARCDCKREWVWQPAGQDGPSAEDQG
jgi:hypothetical protein